MDDQLLLRYSRQIMLPGIDIEGQERLADARVLVVGIGGLGSPIVMYLAASGVGQLVLVDHDQVDLSNLQRQIVHTTARIGEDKVTSAAKTLQALNPEVELITINRKLDAVALADQARQADVIVDATDNFTIRFALNDAALATRTPLVSGAAIRMEGQVSVYDPRRADSPCYRCVYSDVDEELGERCAETGVLGPVVGLIGCVQATETVKLIAEFGETLVGRFLLLDARSMTWTTMVVNKNPDCPACGIAEEGAPLRAG